MAPRVEQSHPDPKKIQTDTLSLIPSGLASRSWYGSGIHGKKQPLGSEVGIPRPLAVIRLPSGETIAKVGMPFTPTAFSSAPLAACWSYGTAGHGIVERYSRYSCSLLSLDTNMISNLSASLGRVCVYQEVSKGVNFLQGGHQCAEKYNPRCFPARLSLSISLPSLSMKFLGSSSVIGFGIQGRSSPVGSSATAPRPSVVIV
mmetsp:Transcript_10450/g.10351  ORF Transcript_10450/g.10351 Transcript_10450/m.10351 type:complete len:202 (+) Transcript_10450:314-919(+)